MSSWTWPTISPMAEFAAAEKLVAAAMKCTDASPRTASIFGNPSSSRRLASKLSVSRQHWSASFAMAQKRSKAMCPFARPRMPPSSTVDLSRLAYFSSVTAHPAATRATRSQSMLSHCSGLETSSSSLWSIWKRSCGARVFHCPDALRRGACSMSTVMPLRRRLPAVSSEAACDLWL